MKNVLKITMVVLCMACLFGCVDPSIKKLNKILDSIEIPEEVTSNLDLKDSYTYQGLLATAI